MLQTFVIGLTIFTCCVGGGVAIWSLMLTHKEKKRRAAHAQENPEL